MILDLGDIRADAPTTTSPAPWPTLPLPLISLGL